MGESIKKIPVGYYNKDTHVTMGEKLIVNGGCIANPYKDPEGSGIITYTSEAKYTDYYTESTKTINNEYKPLSPSDERTWPKYLMPENINVQPSSIFIGSIYGDMINYKYDGASIILVNPARLNGLYTARLMHKCERVVSTAYYNHTLQLVNDSDKPLYYVGYFPKQSQSDALTIAVKDTSGNDTSITIDPLNEYGYYYRYLNNQLYRIYLSNNTQINPQSQTWLNLTPYYEKQSSESDADYSLRLKMRSRYNMSMLELCNLVYNSSFNVLDYNTSNIESTYSTVSCKTVPPYSKIDLCSKTSYSNSSDIAFPYFFLCASYNVDRFRDSDLSTCDYLTTDEYDSNSSLSQYAHAVTVNVDTQKIQYTNHRTWDTYTYSYNKTLYEYMAGAGSSKYSDMLIVYGKNIVFKEE